MKKIRVPGKEEKFDNGTGGTVPLAAMRGKLVEGSNTMTPRKECRGGMRLTEASVEKKRSLGKGKRQ